MRSRTHLKLRNHVGCDFSRTGKDMDRDITVELRQSGRGDFRPRLADVLLPQEELHGVSASCAAQRKSGMGKIGTVNVVRTWVLRSAISTGLGS
jgi:hypothetical protein